MVCQFLSFRKSVPLMMVLLDDSFFILYVFCKKTIIHVYFVCIFMLYCILLACKFAAENEYGG